MPPGLLRRRRCEIAALIPPPRNASRSNNLKVWKLNWGLTTPLFTPWTIANIGPPSIYEELQRQTDTNDDDRECRDAPHDEAEAETRQGVDAQIGVRVDARRDGEQESNRDGDAHHPSGEIGRGLAILRG